MEIPGQGSITNNIFNWTRPTSTTYPGGGRRDYAYDALMQDQAISAADPAGNTVMSRDYARDLEGSILAKNTEHGDYAYEYDDVYQLVSADNPSLSDETFEYDG